MPRKKRNETGNQFEGLIGQGVDFENEVKMADLLNDMQSSKTRHHGSLIRMFTKQDSKEYQDVEKTLGNVVFDVSTKFTNDVAANEKLMTKAMGDYYKLLAACDKYINKKGGTSDKGATRKDKVKQIQQYAQRDLMGIEQAFHAMKSMNAQQQNSLSWDEILHSARMDIVEVDDYSDKRLNVGANAKTGENVGKKLKEGIFSPTVKTTHGKSSLNSSALYNKDGEEGINMEVVESTMINMSNRNVATSRVANLFGVGSLVEQSTNVKVRDKKTGNVKEGSLMTLAKGKSAEDRANDMKDQMTKIKSVEERERIAKGKISPTLQKELSSLQVLDYICGQGDRHRGNYFTEMDGEEKQLTHIHGIDNDNAFSSGVDVEKLARREEGVLNGMRHLRMVVDSDNNLTIPHMDEQLARNILDVKKEELRFILKDLIEAPFIDAAVMRLEKLKVAIKKELDKGNASNVFVKEGNWNKTTLDDFLNASARRQLFGRVKVDQVFNKKNYFLHNKIENINDRIEMTKGDTYIAALINQMIQFDDLYSSYKLDESN